MFLCIFVIRPLDKAQAAPDSFNTNPHAHRILFHHPRTFCSGEELQTARRAVGMPLCDNDATQRTTNKHPKTVSKPFGGLAYQNNYDSVFVCFRFSA